MVRDQLSTSGRCDRWRASEDTSSRQMVERSPEKAGVGGSIPSLATMFSLSYRPSRSQFHSGSFQNFGPPGVASRMKLRWESLALSRYRLFFRTLGSVVSDVAPDLCSSTDPRQSVSGTGRGALLFNDFGDTTGTSRRCNSQRLALVTRLESRPVRCSVAEIGASVQFGE
jgi:hypothetical protein